VNPDIGVCMWCGLADDAEAPRDLARGEDGMWRCRDEVRCQRMTMIMLECGAFA